MRAAVCAVSSWSELDDRDLAGDSGSCSATRPMMADLVAEVDDDRPQVERDLAARRRDELALVVEELDELALRRGRDPHPGVLQPRPLEQAVRRLLGALARDAGEHRCERLLRLGQPLGDRLLDVDVRVELLDGGRRDLLADLVGLDQLGRDRLEAVLVEDRPLEVERDAADEREEEREDGERARCDRAALPAEARRVGGRGGRVGGVGAASDISLSGVPAPGIAALRRAGRVRRDVQHDPEPDDEPLRAVDAARERPTRRYMSVVHGRNSSPSSGSSQPSNASSTRSPKIQIARTAKRGPSRTNRRKKQHMLRAASRFAARDATPTRLHPGDPAGRGGTPRAP